MNKLDIDSVWQKLLFIHPEDYEVWLKIGMALHSEYGDSGYTLFHEWSKTAHNFSEHTVISKWQSFKHKPQGKGVGIGTLIHLAKEHGWHNGLPITENFVPSQIAPPPQNHTSDTSSYAVSLWEEARCEDIAVTLHPYAEKKGIYNSGCAGRGTASGSMVGQQTDCIIIPIFNIKTDELQGVQCINPEGKKQTFGKLSGGSLILGNTSDTSCEWYICEGWASAFSMVFHHQHGKGVCAISFGKSNLDKVASFIAEVHAPQKISILLEQD